MEGAFTKFRALEEEDRKVFDEAMQGFVGVKYEPLIVATQIVAGTNFKLICNATTLTNPPRDFTAELTIFRPLPAEGAHPVITGISEIR